MVSPGPHGHHVLLELFGCRTATCDDPDVVRSGLHAAVRALETDVLGEVYHRFSPRGVSAVVLIGSSHLSCHTWPELGYAALDIYTCGDVHPDAAVRQLIATFGASTWVLRDVLRGQIEAPPRQPYEATDVLIAPGPPDRAE